MECANKAATEAGEALTRFPARAARPRSLLKWAAFMFWVQSISRIGSPLPVICAVISALRVTDLGVGPPRTDVQRLSRRKSANKKLMHRSSCCCYSISSSATTSKVAGNASPSDFAAVRLRARSNLACWRPCRPFSLFLSDGLILDLSAAGSRIATQSSRPSMTTLASPYSVARMALAWRPGRPDPPSVDI